MVMLKKLGVFNWLKTFFFRIFHLFSNCYLLSLAIIMTQAGRFMVTGCEFLEQLTYPERWRNYYVRY